MTYPPDGGQPPYGQGGQPPPDGGQPYGQGGQPPYGSGDQPYGQQPSYGEQPPYGQPPQQPGYGEQPTAAYGQQPSYGEQPYAAQSPYGGAPYDGGVPPKKGTPSWVYILTAGIVVAAIVAVTFIFVNRNDDPGPVAGGSGDQTTSQSADPTDNSVPDPTDATADPTTEDSPSSDPANPAEKPAEADVNAGIFQILKASAGTAITDEQVQQIADCATPQLMDQMSAGTLQNYVAGKDVSTVEEKPIVTKIVQDCATEVGAGG